MSRYCEYCGNRAATSYENCRSCGAPDGKPRVVYRGYLGFPNCLHTDDWIARETSRVMDSVYRAGRQRSAFSSLLSKGPLPEGAGYDYQTILYQRSVN